MYSHAYCQRKCSVILCFYNFQVTNNVTSSRTEASMKYAPCRDKGYRKFRVYATARRVPGSRVLKVPLLRDFLSSAALGIVCSKINLSELYDSEFRWHTCKTKSLLLFASVYKRVIKSSFTSQKSWRRRLMRILRRTVDVLTYQREQKTYWLLQIALIGFRAALLANLPELVSLDCTGTIRSKSLGTFSTSPGRRADTQKFRLTPRLVIFRHCRTSSIQ